MRIDGKMVSSVRTAVAFVLLINIRLSSQVPTTPVEDDLKILTAFRQAHGVNEVVNPDRTYGNCDSIAMIKAGMATFGIDSVFQSPKSLPESNNAESYAVVLRDGHSVNLSHAELDMAIHDLKHNSGFVLPDDNATGNLKVLFKANFIYAVMAKEMLARHDVPLYKNVNNFADALDRMGKGIDVVVDAYGDTPMVNQVGALLGVGLQDVTFEPGVPSVPYMYALRKHVVFAYGDQGDNFGKKDSFAAILQAHSTIFTRKLGKNAHPRKYVIQVP